MSEHYHDAGDLRFLKQMSKLAPSDFAAWLGLDKIVGREDGAIPRKYRELIALAVAIAARHVYHLAGSWRTTYVVTAALALYLNVFVLVAQLFQKVPSLKALAPTGTEPPFLGTELALLVIFIALTVFAVKKFRG